MLCLAAMAILWAVLFKIALMHQRQQRAAEWRMQAEWLVEAAVDRAAARLALDPDYSGETWQIADAALGARAAAVVVIEVRRTDDRPQGRIVHVQADYTRDGVRRARASKQVQAAIINSTETT
jgi:hypothetical protein